MPKSETFSQVGGTQEVARGGTVVGDYTSDYYGGDWDYISTGGDTTTTVRTTNWGGH